MATTFKQKAEERLQLVKKKEEDGGHNADPPTKRACTQVDKLMSKMGPGDLSLVKAGMYCVAVFDKPEDGLPVMEDWMATFESMLFSGIDLGREFSRVMELDEGSHPPGTSTEERLMAVVHQLRMSSDVFDAHADYACIYSALLVEARQLASFTPEKEAQIMKAFYQRDYKSDVEAIVASKLATWKIQHFGLWADVVETPTGPPPCVATAAELVDLEDQAQAARLCQTFMTKCCRVSLLMEKCFADPCADTVFRNLAAAKKEVACLSALHCGVKAPQGAVVLHPTAYDGCLELAGMKLGHAILSSSLIEANYKCTNEIVKSHLLQAWKSNQAPMDKYMPRYKKDPSPEDLPQGASKPTLKICQVAEDSNKLILPKDIRHQFLSCPIWGQEWRDVLTNFDKSWGAPLADTPSPSKPSPMKTETPSPIKQEGDAEYDWKSAFPGEPDMFEKLKEKVGGAENFTEVAGPTSTTTFIIAPGPSLYVHAKEPVKLPCNPLPFITHGWAEGYQVRGKQSGQSHPLFVH
ncbi:unnamed protein product [Durusdinium trenchii]|uniref:Uncharacterized protein n=1 Tax=Durusdinium trenchii TaxID=1381693 RepID=A0ABP0SAJ1_9DINO